MVSFQELIAARGEQGVLALREIASNGAQREVIRKNSTHGHDRLCIVSPSGPPATSAATVSHRPKFGLWTIDEIRAQPSPEWLIEGLLEVGAQGVIYGPSGEGKTFVALDWALSIATGTLWQGRATRKGPVLYVVAEGGRGMRKRLAAWMQTNRLNAIDDIAFVLEAVQVCDKNDLDTFVERIDEQKLKPTLIVLDTFARCFVGRDENSSRGVGEFVAAIHSIQEQTGASVLAVHHTGKHGDAERGSSALRAAADVMFKVSRGNTGTIIVENDKQKDEEACPRIYLQLKTVNLDAEIEGPPTLRSCVLTEGDVEESVNTDGSRFLNQAQRLALTVLNDIGGLATSAHWREAIQVQKGQSVPVRTFQNWRGALEKLGLVECNTEGAYQVTDAGTALINDRPCLPRNDP